MSERCALVLFSPIGTVESRIGALVSTETMSVDIMCRRCPRTPTLVTAENASTLELPRGGTCGEPTFELYVSLTFPNYAAANAWFTGVRMQLVGVSVHFFDPAIDPS